MVDAQAKKSAIDEGLRRANNLISRLRAENAALLEEKQRFINVVDAAKKHPTIDGNYQRKYGVTLVKSQLTKARLI